MSARRAVTPCLLVLVLVLGLVLPAPAAGQLQQEDAVVLEAAPAALPPARVRLIAASTRREQQQQQQEQQQEDEPLLRSSQGPEGFAYESSHSVLDAYGALATATQYHAQDGLGRYRYSYKHPGSAREEYVDENGRIQGSFSYNSQDDEKLSMTYYADETGFHVKRAVLPDLAALAPRDDPDVAAIKAAHISLWRRMWARAAAASVGAPLDPYEPPVEEYEPTPEELPLLESDIISSDPDNEPLVPNVPFIAPKPEQSEPEQDGPEQDEELVPIFPGAPGAPSLPVSSAPKPLPSGVGLSSPDSETVVVSARVGEFSAPGGGRPQEQFQARPLERVGALRLRDAAAVPVALRLFTASSAAPPAAASAPAPARVQARSAASERPAPASAPVWLSSIGGSLPAPAVRVSDEAARAGRLPVAERHSLAQVRPAQRRPEDETAPVLEDPVLYYYSGLLHTARQAATPPRIVVV